MRIGVAATAPIGADVLERLAERHEIAFLLTRPDAPRGRGRKLAPPPAKETAARLGIPVHQPEKPELPAEVERMVVCAYGLYIPPRLLEQSLWLNVHPSLLPRWRGAAPVERAILAGDARDRRDDPPHGRRARRGTDRGARGVRGRRARCGRGVRAQRRDRRTAARRRARGAGVRAAGRGRRHVRREDRARPTGSSTSTTRVDAWRRVRALSPHIGAWTTLHGRRVTIWKAHLDDGAFVARRRAARGRERG